MATRYFNFTNQRLHGIPRSPRAFNYHLHSQLRYSCGGETNLTEQEIVFLQKLLTSLIILIPTNDLCRPEIMNKLQHVLIKIV